MHDIIQVAMGWEDMHPHQFILRTKNKKPTRQELLQLARAGAWEQLEIRKRGERFFTDGRYGDHEGEESNDVTIADVCPHTRMKIAYEYDFGDSWVHDLQVVKIRPPGPGEAVPICLGGALACPPEDCGGVYGYYCMVDALADPKHPRHDEYAEWMDADFDSEAFDLDAVNKVFEAWRRASKRKPSGKPRKGVSTS